MGILLDCCRLARQHHIFFAVSGPMVCYREEERGGHTAIILVVEPDWFVVVFGIRDFLRQAPRYYFCLRFYLDPLYAELNHSLSARKSAYRLR